MDTASVNKIRVKTVNAAGENINLEDFENEMNENVDDENEDELLFPDEVLVDRDGYRESLSPLLFRLKPFGLYFTPKKVCAYCKLKDASNTANTNGKSSELEKRSKKHPNHTIETAYATFVLALLWLNAIRFLTVFNGKDSFNALLLYKLMNTAWTWLAAINQTALFYACQSGRLHRILTEVRITPGMASKIRKNSLIDAIAGFTAYVISATWFVFIFFVSTDAMTFDFYLAPFTTIVPVNSVAVLYALRAIFMLIGIYMLSGWLLPQAMQRSLAMAILSLFMILEERLKRSIDDEGRFDGSIRTFRRRHQLLCRTVRRADRFIKISNVANFGCHMAFVIICVYMMIFYSAADALQTVGLVFWLLMNGFGLLMSTTGGILVNSYAHKLAEHLPNIDVTQFGPKEMNELNMFQRRLAGEPIGFSVLGIFVISKSTFLTVMSLTITYFMLVVRMTKSASADSDLTSCSKLFYNATY